MYFNGKKFVSVKVMSDGAVPVETELDGNSDNPVSNRAVYKALQGISNLFNGFLSRLSNAEQAQTDLKERVKFLEENPPEIPEITVDDKLDLNSTNPAQNKVVTAKINEVGSMAGNVMETASAAHQRIATLETQISEVGTKAYQAYTGLSLLNPKITTLETQVGDIDTALETIIAMQENTLSALRTLSGGDGE